LGSLLGASTYKILYEMDLNIKYWIVLAIVLVVIIMVIVKNKKESKDD
jgi:hypothetical protein